jgi:hypothetical protein
MPLSICWSYHTDPTAVLPTSRITLPPLCHCAFIPTRKYLACVSNTLLFQLFKLLFITASSVQLCTSRSACKQWQPTWYTHRCNKPEKVGNTGHTPYATHHVHRNRQDWDTRASLCCCHYWEHQIGNCSRWPILFFANAPNASCYADCDHHQQLALTKVYTHKTFNTSGAF